MNQENIQIPVGGMTAQQDQQDITALSENEKIKKGICPCCDGALVFQEGCKMCYACGWGGCS